ncbi:MAG TPA: hypothetical protein VF412_14985 [Bdellovibrio sp.]|uniref:hypothetical protein n=1 Tax=Bdellovibrio sp. TaxID=28201 RepID=UPI002EE9B3C4
MTLTRIVSQDEWSQLTVTTQMLKKIQVVLWQDPGTNEILKAFSHEGKVCPVIDIWRKMFLR